MSFWFTLPKQANLVGSQPSRRDDNTTGFTASLSLLMTPWVVSQLCKTPRPASACDVRAAAALGSRPAALARMVRGSRGTVATVTPMHPHAQVHLMLTSHIPRVLGTVSPGQNQLHWYLDALWGPLPPHPGQRGLTLQLTVAAPKRWLHCCTLCHSHLCSYVTNICLLACLIFLHPVFKILKILNLKNQYGCIFFINQEVLLSCLFVFRFQLSEPQHSGSNILLGFELWKREWALFPVWRGFYRCRLGTGPYP